MRTKAKIRITAVEMKFMRRAAKYAWMENKRNEDVLEEPITKPILDNILKYKSS
jgi:hypothetical protein